MPRQPYASPVMNIRIIFIFLHCLFVDLIIVGANRIRPINVFFANRIRPITVFFANRIRPIFSIFYGDPNFTVIQILR